MVKQPFDAVGFYSAGKAPKKTQEKASTSRLRFTAVISLMQGQMEVSSYNISLPKTSL